MLKREWRRVMKLTLVPLHREGWLGVWDALVAAITRRPRFSVASPVTFSVLVKTADPLQIQVSVPELEA